MKEYKGYNNRMFLRNIFDQVALDYDKVRPGYPNNLIEDIISISTIPKEGRILEIGCGTRQATVPFAKLGYSMTCLDIGKELAKFATKKCKNYPKVKIHSISFEDWQPKLNTFDLVISATAFHWIQPEIGYPKVAKVLNNSGYFAIFLNLHPRPYKGFFNKVQNIYNKVVPEWKSKDKKLSTEDNIISTENYINRTGLFEKVLIIKYPWVKKYKTQDYLRLLNTYSDHRNLQETRRVQLFEGIGELIDNKYGGTIIRPYLSVLYIARKRGG